jgi:hypothetical protein
MLLIMIGLQVFVMPYMMVADPAHVYFSITQGYMGAAMGAGMVAIDSLLFHPMPWWGWILTLLVGGLAVAGYRYQWLVSDREYLHDMIPHHSMALVTSRPKENSADPIVSRLAQQIVISQTREIEEMVTRLKMMPAPTRLTRWW